MRKEWLALITRTHGEGEAQDCADQRGPQDSSGSRSPCNACWIPAGMVGLDGGLFSQLGTHSAV